MRLPFTRSTPSRCPKPSCCRPPPTLRSLGARSERKRRPVRIPITERGSVASICGALTTSLQHAPPSASARSLHPPGRGILRSMFRPFGVDRNSCHFLWYGVVAGEGLRSVGADGELPIQELLLYPAPRPPFTGRGSLRCVIPGPHLAAKASGGPIGRAPNQSPGRLPPPALPVPRRA
jgi:hypothetical protein